MLKSYPFVLTWTPSSQTFCQNFFLFCCLAERAENTTLAAVANMLTHSCLSPHPADTERHEVSCLCPRDESSPLFLAPLGPPEQLEGAVLSSGGLRASHWDPSLEIHHQSAVELNPGRSGAQSGYVSRENNGAPKVTTANSTTGMPIMAAPSPAFTCRWPSDVMFNLTVQAGFLCFYRVCLNNKTHHVDDG